MIIKFTPAEGAECKCCKRPWEYNDLVGVFLGSEPLVLCNTHALELVKLLIDRFYPIWGKELLNADTAEAVCEACADLVLEKREAIRRTYGRMGGTWNMIQAILTQVEETIRARGNDEQATG